jgi:deoxyadenosine/deoxycytidine kinase
MNNLRVGVVGPCAAGKSTLVSGLNQRGFQGKNIAQEHSYVPNMWQRLTKPDVLIYLSVSYPVTIRRRKLDWSQAEYEEQIRRLRHAYENADLRIDTDPLNAEEVLERVVDYLQKRAKNAESN